jgi:hypothetical protein
MPRKVEVPILCGVHERREIHRERRDGKSYLIAGTPFGMTCFRVTPGLAMKSKISIRDYSSFLPVSRCAALNAAAHAIFAVAPAPAGKLKWAGSILTAAKPVIIPPEAPLTPAAIRPRV